ncbi:MAG: FtsQ-type POTRA domain-containing protein [Clostridia bacterium]|nr:FtsQ-type POTRA domain-containing protein [Clostridia bacterium]
MGKNKKDNNKFDFDNEVIIGISSSGSKDKKGVKNKKKQKKMAKDKAFKTQKKSKPKKNIKKKSLSTRGKIVLRVACLLVIFIGGTCFILFSPMFNLKEITVKNNDKLSKDEIIELSELKMSENIYSSSKKNISENIETNAYVDSVKVKRIWPNKIEISVVERKPIFMAEVGEGQYAYIDKNGYILEFSGEKLDVPILIGTTTEFESMINEDSNENRLNDSDLKKIKSIDKILKTSDEFGIKNLISKIDITNLKSVALIMESEGKKVYIGNGDDLNRRIMFIVEMIAKEKGINGEFFVDMNLNEKSPYFREAI